MSMRSSLINAGTWITIFLLEDFQFLLNLSKEKSPLLLNYSDCNTFYSPIGIYLLINETNL